MLTQLHIENLAVIDSLTIDFNSSYTALIGETGAGKSLIVTAFGLLTGVKFETSLLRDKMKEALVIAVFEGERLKEIPEIAEYLEDGLLILKRSLTVDNSRCYINDKRVTLTALKNVSAHLVSIHSQKNHDDILSSQKQLFYIDQYGGSELSECKSLFETQYKEYKRLESEYEAFLQSEKDYDPDYLRYQIQEIERYDLKEGEIEELNAEYLRLRDYALLQEKIERIANEFLEENGVRDRIDALLVQLNQFKGTSYEELASHISTQLRDAKFELNDFLAFDHRADQERLDYINSRLYSLRDLMRKYGKSSAEILSKYQGYKDALNKCETFSEELREKENAYKTAYKRAFERAKKLSELRAIAKDKLSHSISEQFALLGLSKEAFYIVLEEKELSSDGIDNCSYMISLNRGLESARLEKVLSGGETSRLMLALRSVLNDLNPYDLLILDEIDSGIDGKIASCVSDAISKMANKSQIIVISHQPQVVSSCVQLIKVEKEVVNGMTSVKIDELNEVEVVEEIAKMISGRNVSAAAIQQARNLRGENKWKK